MRMRILVGAALAALGVAQATHAQNPNARSPTLRPDQVEFRALYKELVETDTTLSAGSCTLAAEQIAARMKAAGFSDAELTLFSTPEHPKEGGLVAVYPGTSKTAKPMLLLAHIDVVEAKRADWTRDPFKMVEENGYYYARGVADDKAMAATWADMLIRFRKSGYKPKRTIKMALTCGEETTYAFNGAEWLAKNKRDLIDAAFALNEGGGGDSDGKGKVLSQGIQVGEKVVQNFKIETVNAGGHSSIPIRDNAIYQLSDAMRAIRDYEFPVELNDTTRAFFTKVAPTYPGEVGAAMAAIAKDPNNKQAEAVLNRDRTFHSLLRTTCVATLLEGGHANNALPQRATANVNCRMFPGRSMEETKAALDKAVNDPGVKITAVPPIRPKATPIPMDPKILGPMEKLSAKYWPGVPVVPGMSTGATDGLYLSPAGIPTYGVPGSWGDPDGNGVHGLNERVEVQAVMVGRDYLTDLVKTLAENP